MGIWKNITSGFIPVVIIIGIFTTAYFINKVSKEAIYQFEAEITSLHIGKNFNGGTGWKLIETTQEHRKFLKWEYGIKVFATTKADTIAAVWIKR